MPWSGKIHDDIAAAEVVYFGVVTVDEIMEATAWLIELEKMRGLRDFLIDVEKFVPAPDFSLFDILEVLSQQQADGALRDGRVALFASETSAAREALEFYENAATNRGWLVKAYSEREEALEWLLAETQDGSS